MALRRVIGSIFCRGSLAVQSIAFQRHLPLGDPVVLAEAFDRWEADEIVLADITASAEGRSVAPALVAQATPLLRTPLTVGGGIRTAAQIEALLRAGADRVFINSITRSNTAFITEAAGIFGSQCIIGWIDVIRVESRLAIFDHLSRKCLDASPRDWMRVLEDSGIGEIILHGVHRDGALDGFDLELAAHAADAHVPVLISGGAGSPAHFEEVFRSSPVAGACAGNMFAYRERAISEVKQHLQPVVPTVRPLHATIFPP